MTHTNYKENMFFEENVPNAEALCASEESSQPGVPKEEANHRLSLFGPLKPCGLRRNLRIDLKLCSSQSLFIWHDPAWNQSHLFEGKESLDERLKRICPTSPPKFTSLVHAQA
jgi:hypothetical protein